MKLSPLSILYILVISFIYQLQAQESIMLPDGVEFKSWDKPLQFSKTYYVDQNHPSASDDNPGTKENPFKTINYNQENGL